MWQFSGFVDSVSQLLEALLEQLPSILQTEQSPSSCLKNSPYTNTVFVLLSNPSCFPPYISWPVTSKNIARLTFPENQSIVDVVGASFVRFGGRGKSSPLVWGRQTKSDCGTAVCAGWRTAFWKQLVLTPDILVASSFSIADCGCLFFCASSHAICPLIRLNHPSTFYSIQLNATFSGPYIVFHL